MPNRSRISACVNIMTLVILVSHSQPLCGATFVLIFLMNPVAASEIAQGKLVLGMSINALSIFLSPLIQQKITISHVWTDNFVDMLGRLERH